MVVVQVTKLSRATMVEATMSQGITKVGEKRVKLGTEAERVEMSSARKSRTGERQRVVRDRLEVFTSRRGPA